MIWVSLEDRKAYIGGFVNVVVEIIMFNHKHSKICDNCKRGYGWNNVQKPKYNEVKIK